MERARSIEKEAESVEKQSWFKDVDNALQGSSFPMDQNKAEETLSGLTIGGRNISQLFGKINWPVKSKQDLINQIHQAQTL